MSEFCVGHRPIGDWGIPDWVRLPQVWSWDLALPQQRTHRLAPFGPQGLQQVDFRRRLELPWKISICSDGQPTCDSGKTLDYFLMSRDLEGCGQVGSSWEVPFKPVIAQPLPALLGVGALPGPHWRIGDTRWAPLLQPTLYLALTFIRSKGCDA